MSLMVNGMNVWHKFVAFPLIPILKWFCNLKILLINQSLIKVRRCLLNNEIIYLFPYETTSFHNIFRTTEQVSTVIFESLLEIFHHLQQKLLKITKNTVKLSEIINHNNNILLLSVQLFSSTHLIQFLKLSLQKSSFKKM